MTREENQVLKHASMSVIRPAIVASIARVLLDRGIPNYISITDVDDLICRVNSNLTGLAPRFRKSQITQTIPEVVYCKNSKSGRGKVSFRLNGDRAVVTTTLRRLIENGGKTV